MDRDKIKMLFRTANPVLGRLAALQSKLTKREYFKLICELVNEEINGFNWNVDPMWTGISIRILGVYKVKAYLYSKGLTLERRYVDSAWCSSKERIYWHDDYQHVYEAVKKFVTQIAADFTNNRYPLIAKQGRPDSLTL